MRRRLVAGLAPAGRWGAACALALALVLGLSACTGAAGGGQTTDRQPVHQAAATKSAKITLQPANGRRGVNPTAPIKLSVAHGTIASVTLHSSTGADVKGKTSPDRHSFSVTEELGYGNTYTWSGTVTGPDGEPVPIKGSFHTLDPQSTTSADLNVGDNATYGVAMPIVVNFDQPVPDSQKAGVQKALSVHTSVPTKGSWAWLSDSSVHWRPKEFWQPGTDVTVQANIHGVSFGGGGYGDSDVTSHFHIGKQQEIKGNVDTHRLKLLENGELIRNYPTSYGLDSVLWRNTRSGIHVVMSKHPVYYMSSRRGGYSHVRTEWATRISDNGEFMHAYPETTWAQGRENVSHGCANLTTARAHFVFNWAQIGDPVVIKGSNVQLSPADGPYYDWTLNWQTWTAKSAV